MAKKDVVYGLAEYVAAVKYDDIPGNVIEVTKKSILDTLGVMLGCSGTVPGPKEMAGLVKSFGGVQESTIVAFGGKAPAWLAAFVNGSLAHGMDYDDMHSWARLHPGAQTVPASFAIAEHLGMVNGKEFITAVALGEDIVCRLGVAVVGDLCPWHESTVLGVFGAAAASGKLLRLDRERIVDAFGIAFCQAAGTKELRYGVGSDIGGMYPAFPANGGVISALMAQAGISGVKSSLEGSAGLFKVYFNGKYDLNALTGGLGKRFEGERIGFKPWPACYVTHTYIEATLGLVNENDIRPENILEITVKVGNLAQTLCEPLQARQKPATVLDAKFSLPFTVAVASAKRKVTIDDFIDEGRQDKVVLETARKVKIVYDKAYDIPATGMPPGFVAIRTKDGRTYEKHIPIPYGHPEKPMTMNDIEKKFRDCVSHSARKVSPTRISKVVEMVSNLENVDDVGKVIQQLG